MNLHNGFHARHAFTLMLVAVVAALTATGTTASAYDGQCVYYETSYKQEVSVIDTNGEARCVSAAEAAAVAEAAAWPNFDSTDMTREIAQYEAQQEAAAWPNFDPTDMTQEIALYEAQQVAESWPNFDSTAIDTSTAASITANSPRMMQIAVE